MELFIQILLSIAAAFVFDWVFQFQVQLIYSGAISGGGPRRYKMGPPSKIVLEILYLIPFNLALHNSDHKISTAFIIFAVMFVVYSLYASYLAIRMMIEEGNQE